MGSACTCGPGTWWAFLIVLRIVWGFIGPEHARFSSFIFPPGTVLRYLWDLLLGRAKRYLGHSPGGGAMVLVLLIGLLGGRSGPAWSSMPSKRTPGRWLRS